MAETFRYAVTASSLQTGETGKVYYTNSSSITFHRFDLDGKEFPTGFKTWMLKMRAESPDADWGLGRYQSGKNSSYDWKEILNGRTSRENFGTPQEGDVVIVEISIHDDSCAWFGYNYGNWHIDGYCSRELWTSDNAPRNSRNFAVRDAHGNDFDIQKGDIIRVTSATGKTWDLDIVLDVQFTENGSKSYHKVISEDWTKTGQFNDQKNNDEADFVNCWGYEIVGNILDGGWGEATNLLKVGDTPISDAFVGGVPVSKIYAGETLVFGAGEGGGEGINFAYEVVAQNKGRWIDGTFTKVFDVSNTGNVDLYVAGGLRVPDGYKLTPDETIQATYTSVEVGKEDTMSLTFTLGDGTLFGTWEEDIITPEWFADPVYPFVMEGFRTLGYGQDYEAGYCKFSSTYIRFSFEDGAIIEPYIQDGADLLVETTFNGNPEGETIYSDCRNWEWEDTCGRANYDSRTAQVIANNNYRYKLTFYQKGEMPDG